MPTSASCLVVGAGISGLLAADRLSQAGFSVTVVDKARAVGGRMATRRIGEAVCDHGAQFLTARDPHFKQLLDQWESRGLLSRWGDGIFHGTPSPPFAVGGSLYRGHPSMTSIAKGYASSLNVVLGSHIVSLASDGKQWSATTEAGSRFDTDAVILTPPLPQSMAVLERGGIELPDEMSAELSAVVYQPVIALLAVLDRASGVPEPGGIFPESDVIRWIADNRQKGISPRVCALTIHATPEFSAGHFEDHPDDLTRLLLGNASEFIGGGKVVESSLHRWRFSEPMMHLNVRCILALDHPPLLLAGDAFGSPRVEGAALSGLAAANLLIDLNT